jgi:hypothetical protein
MQNQYGTYILVNNAPAVGDRLSMPLGKSTQCKVYLNPLVLAQVPIETIVARLNGGGSPVSSSLFIRADAVATAILPVDEGLPYAVCADEAPRAVGSDRGRALLVHGLDGASTTDAFDYCTGMVIAAADKAGHMVPRELPGAPPDAPDFVSMRGPEVPIGLEWLSDSAAVFLFESDDGVAFLLHHWSTWKPDGLEPAADGWSYAPTRAMPNEAKQVLVQMRAATVSDVKASARRPGHSVFYAQAGTPINIAPPPVTVMPVMSPAQMEALAVPATRAAASGAADGDAGSDVALRATSASGAEIRLSSAILDSVPTRKVKKQQQAKPTVVRSASGARIRLPADLFGDDPLAAAEEGRSPGAGHGKTRLVARTSSGSRIRLPADMVTGTTKKHRDRRRKPRSHGVHKGERIN